MNRVFLLLKVVAIVISGVTGTTYLIQSHYVGTTCDGTPYSVTAEESATCSNETTCSTNDNNSSTVSADVVSIECTSDLETSMRKKFGDSPYILQMNFQDENCSLFSVGYGFPASGNCEGSFNETDSYYVIGRLNSNGSTSINYFSANPCLSSSWYNMQSADQETLSSHSCDSNRFKWYSSNDHGSSSTSGFTISVSSLIGIGFGLVFVVVVATAFVFLKRLKAKRVQSQLKLPSGSIPRNVNQVIVHGQTGLWDDDVITTKRIPRDKVVTRKLLSRGAYGEVYAGSFNSRPVAVKMLLPSTRGNLEYVKEFLAEAKMTASLDHPHIVSFVGVAWDSLSDLCVVLEYMENGDLRTILSTYQASNHPVGLNRQKISIALDVCQALTYLHSFLPPIIHRDLKSRNVLLDGQLKAKLSDFGISRERLDRTMTACVGTSLWMAPEVMLGERYDVKADMFSFGVVLSELDVHSMPYARVSRDNVDSNGREVAGVTLFQKVALGTVQVEFSDASPQSVVALGRACMKVDPSERPSAAEAMYRLQVILSSPL
ncbi:hypothetical protein DVH05_003604 [Phytophthora capsici]|nr:hypothetical protein DVH05_003604 [Phytophthora capsici]